MSHGRKSDFQRPPSWISKISISGHVTVIGFNICCSVLNFIKIGWFFTEIWWFSDLQNGGRGPCWICYNVTVLHRRTHFRCANIVVKFLVDRCCSLRDRAYLQYHKNFWLYITENGNFGVAHALCHLTLSRGSKITTRMNFLPLFVYSLRHFYVSTMTIKRCSKESIPIVKRVLGEYFLCPVKNVPQNGANAGKWGARY